MSGSSRTVPIGRRVSAVRPAKVARNTILAQMSRAMSALTWWSTPAWSSACESAATRSDWPPSSSPSCSRASVPVCRIRPGASIVEAIWATPPMTCGAPSTRESTSTLSTPFCSVSTPVAGPTSGRAASAARSVSYSLTAKITSSTGPIAAGSSVASAGQSVRSPRALAIRRPCARIAARWAPRAMKATSWPLAASRPPT